MNTKLYIENLEIELKDEVQFLLNKQFEDITNPTVIINDWSKTVEIPSTQHNDDVFGHIYSPDRIIVEEGNPSVLVESSYNKATTAFYVPTSVYYNTTFESSLNRSHIVMTPTSSVPGGSFAFFTVYTGELPSAAPYNTLNHERQIATSVSSGVVTFTFTASEQYVNNAIRFQCAGGSIYYPSFTLADGINHTSFEPGKTYTVTFDFQRADWGSTANLYLDFYVSVKLVEYDYKHFGVYFDPYRKLDFRLEWNESTVMEGYAKLNEITRKDGHTTYSLTLNGTLGKVFQELKKITFDKSIYNDPNASDEDKKYVIRGWDYCKDTISRHLVDTCWNVTNRWPEYANIDDVVGMTEQFIGFFANNAFSEDFDYTSYVTDSNPLNMEINSTFEDTLQSNFEEVTRIQRSTVLKNGLKPREIGEFRSYNQLPFYWWDMFWQMFMKKAEIITGYQCDYTDNWFSQTNKYWRNWLLKVRDFPLIPQSEQESEKMKTNNIYTVQSLTPRNYPPKLFWGGYYQSTTYNAWNNSVLTSVYMKDVPGQIEKPVYAVGGNAYTSYFQFLQDADIITIPQYNIVCKTGATSRYSNSTNITWHGTRLKIEYLFLDITNQNVAKTITYYVYSTTDKGTPDNSREICVNGTPQLWVRPNAATIRYWNIPIPEYKVSRAALSNLTDGRFRINLVFKWENIGGGTDENGFWANNSTYDDVIELNLLYAMTDNPVVPEVNVPSYKYYRSYSEFDYNDLWDNNYNPFDFILNYCKMFRIGIFIDNINKKIIFKPIHKYLNEGDNTLDWSNKVDYSQDYIIKPISWDTQYVKFNYEDNDIMDNIKYNQEFGFNFGEKNIKTNYVFNKETNELFNGITMGIMYTPYVKSWNNLINNLIIFTLPEEAYLENIKDEDNKQISLFGLQGFGWGSEAFDETSNLRACYLSDDTDLELQNDVYCYNQTNSNRVRAYSHTPYYSYISKNILTTLLATFNMPSKYYTVETPDKVSTNASIYDIYTLFWKRFIDERYNKNNKVVTCYVKLDNNDFQNFEFNKFVNIDNQLYFVNRIFDFNLTSNEPTKVELITIQDPAAYRTNIYDEIL